MNKIKKPLPTSFTQGEFTLKILAQTENVAVLSKRSLKHSRASYETVILRERPAEILFGKQLPQRQTMPGNEDWGIRGWSYTSAAQAMRKYDSLVAAQKEKEAVDAP